jgi:transposase
MIQLAWRFVAFQKDSALIVALARKLLIALWHLVRDGVVPEGVVLPPAQ